MEVDEDQLVDSWSMFNQIPRKFAGLEMWMVKISFFSGLTSICTNTPQDQFYIKLGDKLETPRHWLNILLKTNLLILSYSIALTSF